MKKSFIAILAVMLCFVFVFAGCNSSDKPTGNIVDNSDPVEQEKLVFSDIKIEEGETVAESNLGAEVELFQSGVYYLEGTIYSSGEAMPVLLATDGTNVELTATVSGMSFGILVLEDATYVIQPNAKIYTELSDALIKALGIDDSFNVSEFQSIRDEENDETAKIKQMAVTINGENGLCTEYIYEDTFVKLYSIGDKLVQVENYDMDGTLSMQIVVDSITSQIPSDQLTLKGLSQASVTSFISSFVGTS